MGLDITAYRQLKVLRPATDRETAGDDEVEDGEMLYHFTQSDRRDELQPGQVYECADMTSFRAGSYGGYNLWRNELAQLAGYPSAEHVWAKVKQGPFYELIHFSDCEGVIGPKTSAKLAKDFAEYQPKVDALSNTEGSEWFKSKYAEWREAFEMAADNGAIMFH